VVALENEVSSHVVVDIKENLRVNYNRFTFTGYRHPKKDI